MEKIISVCKTHFDIGFTGLFPEIMQEYKDKMLKAVIKTCQDTAFLGKEKSFKWTMPAWPLLKVLEIADAKDKAEAENLIRQGQLLAHALPFTTHTEFLGEAELNRVFLFSKEFCDRYGLSYPISAKMTDVPGHTWLLPSLLAKAGVKFMHIGCNPGSHPADLPPVFWWEGPDGGRVLTIYSKGSYSTDLTPPEYWELPVWIWLRVTNDNTGPQTAADVERYEQVVKKQYGNGCSFLVGTMDDFYREISKYDLTFLPVVRQDIADSWIHGIMSYPKETALLRRNRRLLTATEKYYNLFLKTDAEIRRQIYDIYDASILYGEHTMGLNVIVDLNYDRRYDKESFQTMRRQENYLRMEASWQEQRDRCSYAVAETQKLYERIRGDGKNCFNPSAISFDGVVAVEENTALNREKQCARIGDRLYSQVKIPGLRTVSARAFKKPDVSNVADYGMYYEIKSDAAYVRISKTSGTVIEYYDTATKKNYALAAGYYQYDVCNYEEICEYLREYAYYFYDWVVTAHGRMAYPDKFEHFTDIAQAVSVREYNGGVEVVFQPKDPFSYEEYGNAKSIRVFYALFGNRLRIQVKLSEKQATPMVEALHYVFDFNFQNPTYKINKVGSIVDPESDIAVGGNNILYCMENYVDISDGENALALLSHDAPLFSIGEQTLYKFSPIYKKRRDCKIYVNLANTMWGTNFPQWIEGDFNFTFDLLPHAASKSVLDKIENLISPPIFAEGGKDRYAIKLAGAELIDIKSAGDESFLLRIKRKENTSGKVVLSGQFADAVLTECDLFERKLFVVGKNCKSVKLNFQANETKTILLEKAEER